MDNRAIADYMNALIPHLQSKPCDYCDAFARLVLEDGDIVLRTFHDNVCPVLAHWNAQGARR